MQFNPQEPTIGFQPQQITGNANQLQAEANRQAQGDQQYLNSVIRANEQKVRNAEKRAKDMVALGEFSSTLLKQGTETLKGIAVEREANQMFDDLFGGASTDFTPEEQQEEKELNELSNATAQTANEVEQETGDAALGEFVATQSPAGQISTAYNNQRASLTTAQLGYGTFINNYLNSDATITVAGETMPIAAAMRSGNPALASAGLAAARSAFYRSYGLDRYSRRRVIKALGQTILNTDNQLLTSYTNDAIRARRDEAKAEISNQAYVAGQQSEDLGSSFRTLADTAFGSGAFSSRGEANEAVVKQMLEGLAANGDVDGINDLAGEPKIEGNPGTALGGQYRQLFDEAIAKAEGAQEVIVSEGIKDIQAGMYRDLSNATTKEQKDQIIEAAATALEQQGSYQEARQLRQNRDGLVVAGAADFNAAQLEERIRSGEITSAEQIDQEQLLGNISDDDAKALKGMLRTAKGAEKPENKTAADIASDWGRRVESDLSVVFGLKKDALGNYVAEGSMSVGEAELIYGATQREINLIVNNLLETNPGLANDPIQLQRVVGQELKEWYNTNFQQKGGKYFIGDIQANANAEDYQDLTPEQLQRFRDIANSPGYLATPRASQRSYGRPQNLVGIRQSPGGFTPAIARNFNPLRGDRVFTRQEVETLRNDFSNGNVQQMLSRTAQQLGLSPAALLQQQSNAYGMGVVPAYTSPSTGNAPISAVQGAQRLMSMGMPLKGASWLSGNIQTESNWNGMRTWDDVGAPAGGIVSWRAGRLEALQQRFGRPVTEITTEQQLQYLMEELKQPMYAEARRIFMNPYATERQLIRASKDFFGYGVEGTRYTNARQIERQMRTGAGASRTQSSRPTTGGRQLAYTSGNIGPTSTGPHLDVKRVDGGRFEANALDNYVIVDDPEFGEVSLGEIRTRTGGVGDSWDEHAARGSHGIDYGLHSGTRVYVTNGARVVSNSPTAHGDYVVIQLPNGDQYSFLHGKG